MEYIRVQEKLEKEEILINQIKIPLVSKRPCYFFTFLQ